jgi:lysozyme family protein
MRALQRACGAAPDGHFGPTTLARLAATSAHDLVCLLLAERLEYMTAAKNWQQAGKGWARRIATNLRYSAQDTP